MDLLMDGLLIAATLFAGGYCWVLGRRVQDLKSLDRGLGGSIVTLTRQIELARATLDEARGASNGTGVELERLIGRADAAANQLRLLIAAAPALPPSPPVGAVAPQDESRVECRAEPRAEARQPAPEPESPPAQAVAALAAAPVTVAMNLAEVPKPRALAPVENPLRRAKGAGAAAIAAAARPEPPSSEDAILEALTALAAGGR